MPGFIRNWEKMNKQKKDGKGDKAFAQEDDSEEFREEDKYLVRIIVRKMRNKAAGTTGDLHLLPIAKLTSSPLCH